MSCQTELFRCCRAPIHSGLALEMLEIGSWLLEISGWLLEMPKQTQSGPKVPNIRELRLRTFDFNVR